MNAATLVALFIGLAIANFGFQMVMGQHWGMAADRSFFQAVALLAAYFIGSNA